jgi:hypothetical protein
MKDKVTKHQRYLLIGHQAKVVRKSWFAAGFTTRLRSGSYRILS